jgi:hypothetical protein
MPRRVAAGVEPAEALDQAAPVRARRALRIDHFVVAGRLQERAAARRATGPLRQPRRSSVKGSRVRRRAAGRARRAGRVADALEAREPAALGFERVDRQRLVVAAAGVHHVIAAAAERAARPGVEQVEGQRRMHADVRVQRRGRLPGAVTHRADELADRPGRPQRHRMAVAGNPVAPRREARRVHLQALERRIDEAHRAAGAAFLAHHGQGSSAMAQLDAHAAGLEVAAGAGSGTPSAARTSRARTRSRARAGPRAPRAGLARRRCGSMKRSCSSVPQRGSRETASGRCQKRATSARSSSCCTRLIRACGGISNRAARAGRAARSPSRASTACRCRTRRGACCR